MRLIKKNKFLSLCTVYLIFALIGFWFLTKSWLPEGFVLAGHDSGLALDAKQFLNSRFYAWDDHLNFGQDNAVNFGSITLHVIDYILTILAGNQAAGNYLLIFFWLAILFSSALVFAFSVKDNFGKVFVFIFPVFITFNFYVFQSIFMLERAKYGLLSATLIFLAISLRVLTRKMEILLAAILSAIIFFVFNGGSIWGLPLYGGLIVMVLVLLLYTTIWGFLTRKFEQVYKLLTFLVLTLVGYILINSYAILPYLVKLFYGDLSNFFNESITVPNKSWLNYISQSSSFINMFRLQGIPDWYTDQYNINLNHPYAEAYFKDQTLIAVSFLFPVLAFSSLLLVKTTIQRRLISFFVLLIVVVLIFMAGTHPPLGFIYDFLYDKVPGFVIFRTPFYKFGSTFFLSMSVLIGFTLSICSIKIVSFIKNDGLKSISTLFLTIIIIGGWLWYYKPLFSPQVLYWQKSATTKVHIPDYVQDFKNWADNNYTNGRILLLPSLDEGWKVDSYSWGYWSLSTLPSMLTFKNTLANDASLSPEERNWLQELYLSIEQGDKEEKILNLSSRLGINFFLVRNDILADDHLFSLKSPQKFENILSSLIHIKKAKIFGEWTIYKIDSEFNKKIYAISSLVAIPQNYPFLYRSFASNSNIFLVPQKESKSNNIPRDLFSAELTYYQCESCLIENIETNADLPKVRVLPNSPLYLLKKIREKKELLLATNDKEKINVYLGATLRRAGEVKNMLDFREREKYLIGSLKMMNDYLVITHQLLSSTSDPKEDFEKARMIIQILNPIEINLRIELDKARSGTFGENVIQGLTDVLWQIYRIKTFYTPILNDENKWRNEKVFHVNLTEKNSDGLFISTHFLPFDTDGQRIYPKTATLTQENKEWPLKIIKKSEDIIHMESPPGLIGAFTLVVRFDNLPNIFKSHGYKLEQSPSGTISCYYGSIERFDSSLFYKVRISASRKDQALKLFVREDNKEDPQLQYFIKGQRELGIYPILNYQPFTYIYYPSINSKYLNIYVCNENKEKPQIDNVTAEEIFSPFVVLNNESDKKFSIKAPSVDYDKKNPTRYELQLQRSATPFILIFNERFDKLWRLREISNSDEGQNNPFGLIKGLFSKSNKIISNHFIVDGYANGWKVDSLGTGKFVIEYFPQKAFYVGALISIAVFCISFLGIFIYLLKRRKRQ
ncbi:hypothetical protein HY404_00955 [Candidatus Microgenomates bacterium]|nr:hypothetical protein [Candidatus Microgenomates bacterium]